MDENQGTKSKWNRPLRIASILILLPLLTSCINGTIDIKLNEKALATGTFHLEINKQLGAMMGMTSTKTALATLTKESGLPKDAKTKVTENDDSYLFDVEIKEVPLEDSSATAKVLPNGNIEFHYVTVVEEPSADESDPDLSGLAQSRIEYKVQMPGKILQVSGEGQKAFKKLDETKFEISDESKFSIDLRITSSVDKSIFSKIISSITRSTITCTKGKVTKKVSGNKPICPKGYTKK
jgi:hypothetical protein